MSHRPPPLPTTAQLPSPAILVPPSKSKTGGVRTIKKLPVLVWSGMEDASSQEVVQVVVQYIVLVGNPRVQNLKIIIIYIFYIK
jgi:hypothetical protein